jgi:hypothetical protein
LVDFEIYDTKLEELDLEAALNFDGSRTRVAAVKEKRPIVIQRNLAAWIALYGI